MSRFYVRAYAVALCAALFSSAVGLSSAATIVLDDPNPVTLQDLLAPNASYLVGDKLFEDFTYAYTNDMPSPANINVLPILDSFGNYGIRFQGGFLDLPGGGASDALITFNVTATDPTLLISDAHLAANVALQGPGLAAVTETFLPLFNDVSLLVYDAPGGTLLTDEVVFNVPVRTLPVQKDILLFAMGSWPNFATMSFVDQTFSQVPDPNQNEIPEPASLALMSLGSLFLGAIYMRRRLG